MEEYRVYFNKHKYQDLSDTPKNGSMTVESDNAENAGYLVAELRDKTSIEGIWTKQNNRYYIGNIQYSFTQLASDTPLKHITAK